MLNEGQPLPADTLKVINYSNVVVEQAMNAGEINTTEAVVLANIASSIRRGHPQVRPCPPKTDRICLVGSGPSLADTEAELRDLYFAGAKVVTVNGAYKWCVERNIRPATQVIVDARASNARFLSPAVPNCRYMLASQCAPETWDAVEGRPHVWIFHSSGGAGDVKQLLDDYYMGQWFGVIGGVTVTTRAICLLRMVGYSRFDLFGIDSCWRGDRHHAFDQPENSGDMWFNLRAGPDAQSPASDKVFKVAPWHLKQLEDFLQLIKVHGSEFQLVVHGDGLLAYALQSLGRSWDVEPAALQDVAIA